jgi:hypothetical protein
VHDGQTAAALGVAIWETVFETSSTLDVTKGAFSISGNDAVANAANAMLATLPQSYTPSGCETILYNGSSQSFLVDLPDPAPEPTTIALLAIGGIFAAIRRR